MRAALAGVGLLAAGLVLGGCNKITTAANIANGSCSVTLSGALTGTYNCAPAGVAYNSTKDSSGFGFSIASSGTQNGVTSAIAWQGHPAATDYVNGVSANSAGGITVSTTTGMTWAALGGPSSQGTYDLKITSVGSGITSGSSTAYASTGTLTATLVAVGGGASGSVNATVTF